MTDASYVSRLIYTEGLAHHPASDLPVGVQYAQLRSLADRLGLFAACALLDEKVMPSDRVAVIPDWVEATRNPVWIDRGDYLVEHRDLVPEGQEGAERFDGPPDIFDLLTNAGAEPAIVLEDGTIAHRGDLVFNFYDRCVVEIYTTPDAQGWVDTKTVPVPSGADTHPAFKSLNGERMCSLATARAKGWCRE